VTQAVVMVRSALFYLGYATLTVLWGSLSVLVGWCLPYRRRFTFVIGNWTRMTLAWLRITCGIDYRVEGREHIPDSPCVVLCRHESTWETLVVQLLFAPQATIIKRELLWIPFFGWAFSLLRPIAIDRRAGRRALRKLIEEGEDRLRSGIWVVLFPEGTRMSRGRLGDFQAGGAALASHSGAPVLVVAHDAGACWPARRFLKYPGHIHVRIAAPLETAGKSTKAINEEASALMRRLMADIDAPLATPAGAAKEPA